ncbi:hypothetical protein NDU88_002262 [Pleurodeles waltl]|uniref:Uncharacterized protein n=1 Tax=Pleurodeles waltl TaxID=8319 RepID=A0AAV7U8X5_PLEWA|nr:hypothetical protein NDU88_002262 [Pleurodeles waltl]
MEREVRGALIVACINWEEMGCKTIKGPMRSLKGVGYRYESQQYADGHSHDSHQESDKFSQEICPTISLNESSWLERAPAGAWMQLEILLESKRLARQWQLGSAHQGSGRHREGREVEEEPWSKTSAALVVAQMELSDVEEEGREEQEDAMMVNLRDLEVWVYQPNPPLKVYRKWKRGCREPGLVTAGTEAAFR